MSCNAHPEATLYGSTENGESAIRCSVCGSVVQRTPGTTWLDGNGIFEDEDSRSDSWPPIEDINEQASDDESSDESSDEPNDEPNEEPTEEQA